MVEGVAVFVGVGHGGPIAVMSPSNFGASSADSDCVGLMETCLIGLPFSLLGLLAMRQLPMPTQRAALHVDREANRGSKLPTPAAGVKEDARGRSNFRGQRTDSQSFVQKVVVYLRSAVRPSQDTPDLKGKRRTGLAAMAGRPN